MIAVLGGLGAAVSWAIATLCSSRASRALPATTVLAGVMLTGFALVVPLVALTGTESGLDGSSVGWLLVSGTCNVAGLGFVYRGVRHGKVAIVGALASTEGAIAAVLAVSTGEQLSAPTACVLAVLVGAVLVVGLGEVRGGDVDYPDTRIAVFCGIASALLFGLSLFAAGKAAADVPAVWVAVPARLAGVLLITLPVAFRRRLHFGRGTLPFVVIAGIAEVTGTMSFAVGARHGIAVTAVLAAEFAALAAIAAYFWFEERLNRRQVVGVAVIAIAVAAISALRV